MKKFFFLAAALVAAVSMNAENKIWDFSNEGDTINTVAAINAKATYDSDKILLEDKTSSDGKPYVSWKNKVAAEEVSLQFNNFPMSITYKNKDNNKEFVKTYGSYFQLNSKGVKLTFTVAVGDTIAFDVKSYSKIVNFNVTGANVETLSTPKDEATVLKVVATATTVEFDSNVDGSAACQFEAISILSSDAPQAIENTVEAVKATKVIENGQMVIIRNGVKYNANGMAL